MSVSIYKVWTNQKPEILALSLSKSDSLAPWVGVGWVEVWVVPVSCEIKTISAQQLKLVLGWSLAIDVRKYLNEQSNEEYICVLASEPICTFDPQTVVGVSKPPVTVVLAFIIVR